MKKRTTVVLSVIAVIAVVAAIVYISLYCLSFFAYKGKGILPNMRKVNSEFDSYKAVWYETAISDFQSTETDKDENTVSEFVLMNSWTEEEYPYSGVEYINIRIYSDGTGKMFRKQHGGPIYSEYVRRDSREYVNLGITHSPRIEFDKSIVLGKEQIEELVGIVENNDFWNMPSWQPESEPDIPNIEEYDIYVEGIAENKYNIVYACYPGKEKEIRKIYDGIMACADSWGLKIE